MNFNDKSAFIAIIGRPNVGKSSILNKLLGQKVAIVSSKPQTTRTRIMGVLTEGKDQLVFLDTPGMHKPKNSLGDYMVRSINESVAGVDACLLVTEAGQEIRENERMLIEKVKKLDLPCVLAINKTDTINDKEVILEQIIKYSKEMDFDAIVPVSAETGSKLDELKEELKKFTSEGGHFFPDDTLTDQPEKVLAAEMIREKILRLTEKEIPHGTAVVIERMKMRDDKNLMDIDATIVCERDSHKGIIIGKGGEMLKKIGTNARYEIEKQLGNKVNLKLWVKVKKEWRDSDILIKNFGYDKKDNKTQN